MITLFLFAASLIGHGIGYGSFSLFHPMLIISLKNFRFSNLIAFCKENKSLVFMAVYSATSIFWATSARIGTRELALILMGEAVVFFVAYSEVTSTKLFKVLKIVVILNLVISICEAFKLFQFPSSAYSKWAPLIGRKTVIALEGIPTGLHYNPNNNALFVLMFSPIMLSKLEKRWAAAYLIIASVVIFMSTSKMILVAWMFFLFVLLVRLSIKKMGILKSASGFICLFLLLLSILSVLDNPKIDAYKKTIPFILTFLNEAPVQVYNRLQGNEVHNDYLKIDRSLHHRLLLVDGLAKILHKDWLWGIGGGSLEPITHTHEDITLSMRMPHFYFLEIFAKYGIIVLISYLFWLGRLFIKSSRINPLYGLSLMLFIIFNPVMSSAMYFLPKWGLYGLLLKLIRENSLPLDT